ncbi:MAG: M20/M25/M40 family metallo-hydrolase [Caldilineaceae bacterium]
MHTDRLISFTQALVQRPSLSGEEAQVAARVEEEMRALGFDAVDTDAYGNVIGVVNGAQPGKTLLFDAHTDTVGISPGVPWDRDPFSGAVADGAIHGRGAADMKGALAAMVHAAAAVDRSALRGRVVVSASTLEEVLEGVALEQVMDALPAGLARHWRGQQFDAGAAETAAPRFTWRRSAARPRLLAGETTPCSTSRHCRGGGACRCRTIRAWGRPSTH